MVRSILHSAFHRHLYTGQVTPQRLFGAIHIINYACNIIFEGILGHLSRLNLTAWPEVSYILIDGGIYWLHCREE